MKLSYEQLRHLASLGNPSGQLTVKKRKGQVIRPSLKQWGPKNPKEMPYTSTKEPQRPAIPRPANKSPPCSSDKFG